MSLFDGPEVTPQDDDRRLLRQIERVYERMRDGAWRTLAEIRELTDDPEPSIGARLRDLRKPWWGGHEVEHRRRKDGGGTWEYRVRVSEVGLLDGSNEPDSATVTWRDCEAIVFCVEHRDVHPPTVTYLTPADERSPDDRRSCERESWRPVRVKCEGGLW